MTTSITGRRLELGRVLSPLLAGRGGPAVHFNLAGQQANTLLHDGLAWPAFRSSAVAATRRALRAAQAGSASLFVHASFAFVAAVERGARLDEPLRSCADTILECEALVLAGPVPACVVRLGYLYGPVSADLRAYRQAFRLGRPYWSGLSAAGQYHLHQLDAATALLAAARPQRAGKTFYATDGHVVPFERFMDDFARRIGQPIPLHLPLVSRRLARLVIGDGHLQQTALAMPRPAPHPPVPGWQPRFADYRLGLDQLIAAWQPAGRP